MKTAIKVSSLWLIAFALGMLSSPAFAAVNLSVQGLVEIVIYLLVIGGIFWLLIWLVNYISPPEPIAKVIKIIIMVVGVLILINVLLSFAGHPIVNMR